MRLEFKQIPTGYLVHAQNMKCKLIKGKGPVPEKTKLPIGSMVYVNKFMFKHEDLTAARLKNHKVGQHGRHTAAKNMDEFVQKYISINKVIKMPNGDWYVKNITPLPPHNIDAACYIALCACVQGVHM